MTFDPDIIVTDEYNKPMLVVETRFAETASEELQMELIDYMWSTHCTVGLLVEPTLISIFRDSYLKESSDSIRKVGEFPIPEIKPHDEEFEFEDAVQRWLGGLLEKTDAGNWNGLAWEAVSANILPALRSGEIRAAHPRYRYA